MNLRNVGIALISLALLVSAACSPTKSEAELAAEALQRGLEAHGTGRLDDAAVAYREVLVHDPQSKFAYHNLGLIEQTREHPEAAEAYYRLALGIDPNFTSALFNLAILRTQAGAFQEAIDLYQKVIELEPENASAHLNLGFALLEVRQNEEAQRHFQLATELDPGLTQRIPQEQFPTPTP